MKIITLFSMIISGIITWACVEILQMISVKETLILALILFAITFVIIVGIIQIWGGTGFRPEPTWERKGYSRIDKKYWSTIDSY